ncbi:MAG: efflux RND transporter periplasmic adaptor subunit, partial [Pirellulaceae bacterium]
MTRRVGTTAATAVILVLLGVGIWFAMGNHRVRSSEETAATAEPAAPEGVVRLTEIKRQAAGIRVAPVVRRTFRHMHQVPGRLQYDDRRHVELKAATGGTVQTCTVKPGDRVEPGQVVAVLSSPEVGQARAEVLKRQAEWHIAQRQAQWLEQADRNVQELVAEIRRKAPWDDIERQFHNRPLGESRARLLSAYTRSMLAETMVASIQSAADDGAVAARTLLERRS